MLELGAPSPIGLGTADCESLSSYVQRLSAANGTYPGQLVHRVLGWIEEGHLQEIGGWCHHPRRVYLDRNNNAFRLAAIWLALLRRVTPKLPLVSLTTNSWDLAFPSRGFLHPTLSWCPLCLAADKTPYHRLLWMLRPVTHCDVHQISLAQTCARCGRAPPVLHDRSLTVICPYCGGDLRRGCSAFGSFDNQATIELGNIIGNYGADVPPTEWRSYAGIHALSDFRKLTQPVQLARAVGISKLTAWYWWTGKAGISLPMALHVYSRLGCSFSSAVVRGNIQLLDSVQPQLHLRGRKPARNIDWRMVHAGLRAVLRRPLNNAPTFLAASRELGIERRTLRSHLPHLCRRISKRYEQRLRNERKQREVTLTRSIKNAIRTLHATGLEPLQFRVAQILQQPGLFNRHYARRLFAKLHHAAR